MSKLITNLMTNEQPITRLTETYSVAFLRTKMGISHTALQSWVTNPETIAFKNIAKLHAEELITKEERDLLLINREQYLKTIKGKRGAHLRKDKA